MITSEKNMKVYETVIEQIQNSIIDGTLKKGDKLPTERNLAIQFGVSRASVREAIRALEVIGLVESRHGGGNYIRENFEKSLFEPLSMMFMLEKSNPVDILELRRIIEVETSALAAKRIDISQLEKLKDLVDKMKSTDNEDDNAVFDREFHYCIARASGNILVIGVLNVLSILMDKFIKEARGMILSDKENWPMLNGQHESIYKALLEHDPAASSGAMRKHFELIEKCLKRNG